MFGGRRVQVGESKFQWHGCQRVEINAIPIMERVAYLESQLEVTRELLGKVQPPDAELPRLIRSIYDDRIRARRSLTAALRAFSFATSNTGAQSNATIQPADCFSQRRFRTNRVRRRYQESSAFDPPFRPPVWPSTEKASPRLGNVFPLAIWVTLCFDFKHGNDRR
jgi:hypothetical protein